MPCFLRHRLAHCLFSPGLATHVGLLSLAALLLVAMCAPHAWYSQNRRMVVSGVLLARSAVAVLMPKVSLTSHTRPAVQACQASLNDHLDMRMSCDTHRLHAWPLPLRVASCSSC